MRRNSRFEPYRHHRSSSSSSSSNSNSIVASVSHRPRVNHRRAWRHLLSGIGLPCAAAATVAAAAASGFFSLQQQQPTQTLAAADQRQQALHRAYLHPTPSDASPLYNLRCCGPNLPGSAWDHNWDLLADRAQPGGRVRRVVLVRHGRFRLSTHHLDDMGRQQADILGRRLAELHAAHGIHRLVSSDSTRAVETAELALKHLPHLSRGECTLLKEIGCPCPPEPAQSDYRPEHRYHEGSARAEAAFRRHFHRAVAEDSDSDNNNNNNSSSSSSSTTKTSDSSLEVLVCHANVIRYFVCRSLQLPPEAWLRFSVDHCSITWLDFYPDGRVCLRSFSDSGYMPERCVTRMNAD